MEHYEILRIKISEFEIFHPVKTYYNKTAGSFNNAEKRSFQTIKDIDSRF